MNRSRVIAVASVVLLGGLTGFLVDFDGDGRTNGQELRDGTLGLQRDSDRDGLDDGAEFQLGLDPRDADMDRDGVLDGSEGALQCVRATDCDLDGLGDGEETDGFDPLDPDSYNVGLNDGVVAAFAKAGQPASPDLDNDGIPDGWEAQDGLISWGGFAPQPNRTDLLVEFLRVEGPDSGRFNLDFDPAYEAVAQMFAAEGIALSWLETVVSLDEEHRPDFLTEDELGYYDTVLGQGRASTNPFVTTIVLNPQQTQEDLAGDILGAAFLRSMIATVDYGAHTVVTFSEDHSNQITFTGQTMTLRPVLESHIVGARIEQVRQLRFSDEGVTSMGVRPNGDLFLRTKDSGNEFDWQWTPDWFDTAPNITLRSDPSVYLQLRIDDADLQTAELASTIAHELGHTLGLCHAHEMECYQEFDAADINQAAVDSTTMSYSAPQTTLHFLASEWAQVNEYLQCPPQEPVVITAADGTDADLLDAKYTRSFEEAVDLRSCGDAEPVPADLPEPTEPATGGGWMAFYLAGAVGAVAIAFWRT